MNSYHDVMMSADVNESSVLRMFTVRMHDIVVAEVPETPRFIFEVTR